MIPKIIHFCWLSDDEYPDLIKKCIASWKEKLPEFEIKHWDKKCLDELNSDWVYEAFSAKKYAFAADYIRLYAIYNYGGFYLDSDVEVIKDFTDLLNYPYIFGYEASTNFDVIEAATFGAEKGNIYIKKCLEYYTNRHFIKENNDYDMLPLPRVLQKCLAEDMISIDSLNSFNPDSKKIQILPRDFFSPKSFEDGNIKVTPNTYSIHHFTATWFNKKDKIKRSFYQNFINKNNIIKSIYNFFRHKKQ